MDNMLGFPDFILIDEKLNEKHKMVCNRHFYYKNSLTTRGPGPGPYIDHVLYEGPRRFGEHLVNCHHGNIFFRNTYDVR